MTQQQADDWKGEHLIRGQRPSQMRNPAGSIAQKVKRAVESKKAKETAVKKGSRK